MRPIVYFSTLLMMVWGISCKVSPQNIHKPTSTSDEYYLSKKGTEDRLYAMLSGTFVCFLADDDKKPWLVNDNRDTVLFRSVPVGDVRKGYWLYQEMMMSHMPERPIEQIFVNVVPTKDRDSLLLSYYVDKEMYRFATLQPNSGLAGQVNFKNLQPTGCVKYFVKKEQTFFEGGTVKDRECPCTNKGEEVSALTTDEAVYPVGMSILQSFWSPDNKLHSKSRLYLERRKY